ncbi:Spy0128 family protein [Bifidobacterium cebidarum]|uniref:Spy0128 family protein n=1 Tax=Bifidobacterium cebidarum TaxID=2650773 RepID=UPI00186B3985|nr:FctA domain-containing protein [Bifidobacterium cebidarum]
MSFDKASNADGSKDGGFGFDQTRKPVLTIGDATLTEGTDYSLDKYDADSFKITFKNSDAIKTAIGNADVQVKYWTVSDKTPGTYKNTAKMKYNGKTTSASDSYDIENTNLVNKTGSMKWVKDFDWSQIDPADTTKGAWVADWQVDVNKGDGGIGKIDTLGKPIVVTDTLPQGMSYVPSSGKYTVKAGSKPGSQAGKLDDVMSSANSQLTFTIPTDGVKQQDGSDKAYAKLTYQTAAKGTGQEVSFTNKAAADSGSTHFGEDSSTVTGSSKVIDKSAVQNKDLNHVRYTIKVNPEGTDLVKDSDTVTLSDLMDPEGTFIPSSLKITNSNTGATLIVPVKVENVSDNGAPTTKLTLALPDSTPVTVVYDVKPNGKPGDKVNLTNTATLEGVVNGQDINKHDWTVTNPSSGTDGAAGSIAITKTDAADLSRHLSGAKFALYQVKMDELSGANVTFDQVKAAATKAGDDVTTNANGVATFGSTDKPLATNTLYYFVETVAPKAADGTEYKLDTTPHYFMLAGTDANESAAALAKAKAFGLPVSDSTSFNVYDERKPVAVNGSVILGKQLTGRAWTDADAFTFQLAPDTKNSEDVTADEVKAAMPKTATATARKTGNGADGSISTFAFGGFTFSEPGTYAYTVKETSKGGNGVTVDARSASIKFAVEQDASGKLEIKGGQAEVSGITENQGNWTFSNTYKPTETTVSNAIKVKKTFEGRQWRDGDSFEFRLQPAAPTEDAPLPDGAADGYAKLNVTDTNEHAFGSITYTKAGEYHYTVFEHTPTANNGEHALPGVDYSNALYNVTVTIKDDGKGKLTNGGVTMTKAQNDDGTAADGAVVKGNVAAVTNTYKAEEANFGLLVMKKYTDKTGSNPLTNGKFSFTLTAKDGAPLPASATGNSVVANVTKAGVASFPEIKLTSARDDGKTYEYTLKENVPSGALTSADGKTATLNGMTYDLTTYTVQVPVAMTTDKDGKQVLGYQVKVLDENGNAVDASKLDNGRPVFSNTYQLTPVEANIAGQKTLTGRNMDANEKFTFRLAAAEDDTAEARAARAGLKDDSIVFGSDKSADKLETTVENAQDGRPAAFNFDGIHFIKPGTFKFAVTEVGNVKAGTHKDGHVGYVTVMVKDNGDGTLTATPAYDNADALTDSDKAATDKSAFTNSYAPTGYAFFQLHKKLTASDGVAAPKLTAGKFSFGLYQGDGTDGKTPIQTKTNVAPALGGTTGNVTFERIDYTPASLAQAVNEGYATYNAVTKTWNLTYTAAELDANGNPVAADYTKDGVAYDTTTRKIEVTVTDTGNGALQTGYIVSDGDPNTSTNADSEDAAFNNVYVPAPATANLYAQKVLDGRDWAADGSDNFDFKLEAVSGKITANKADVAKANIPMPTGAVNGELIKSVTDGNEFNFGDIEYTKAGTYVYNISEVTPDNPLPGVSYSTDLYRATVTVTDNGKGQLSSKVAMELVSKVDPSAKQGRPVETKAQNGEPLARITNTYDAAGQTAVAGTKKVTGDDGSNQTANFAKKFTFTLTGQNGAPVRVADANGKIQNKSELTATNNADGTVAFGSLHYTLADLKDAVADASGTRSKTFTYEVAESGAADGVTNDAAAIKTFAVTVADNGSGALAVTTEPGDTANLFSFENAYAAAAQLTLTGTKTLEGRALTADDVFTFNVYEGTDTTGTPISTGTSDATGKIAFSNPLSYTLKDLGDHTYTVVESDANMPGGVTAVTRTHTFTVNVADTDHNGTLKLTANGLGDQNGSNGLTFENNYTTEDSTPIEFKGVKLLDDGDYATTLAQLKGKFTFTLKGQDGAPLHVLDADGKTAADKSELTAKNDEAGNIDFGKMVYHFANLDGQTERTFTYTVTESGDVAGVANDAKTTRTFTVTLHDNGDGTLSATTDPASGALFAFTNTYSAGKADDAFNFTKTLSGRALKDGEFTFTLTGATDAPLPEGATNGIKTVTNDKDGKIAFGKITYTKPGVYTYTVRETAGDLSGVTYDDTVYTVIVTVVDNHDGTMTATHQIMRTASAASTPVKDKDAVFANTYTPPVPSVTRATAELHAQKQLEGRDWRDGDSFTFKLEAVGGTLADHGTNVAKNDVPMPDGARNGVLTHDATDGKSFGFGRMTYTKAGIYTYTISEVKPEHALPGVSYSADWYRATVTVTDNGKGKLSSAVAMEPVSQRNGSAETVNATGDSVALFTNTYDAAGLLAVAGTKSVKGDDGKDYTADFGGKFTFTLTGKDGAPIRVAGDSGTLETKESLVARNTAAGTVNFGALHYTLADLADAAPAADGTRSKTFTYEVAESGAADGVTNDAAVVKTFTVTVADNGTGALKVTTEPGDTANLFSFENTYAASAQLTLTGTKTLEGRALTADDVFTFNVYEGTGVTGDPVATGTNDASGTITFDKPLSYTLANLGNHTYTVVESEEGLPGGVSAVTRTSTFTVNVEDKDHNGTLTLTTSGLGEDNSLTFENNYTTMDSTPIELKGVKLLDDGDYATTLSQLKGKFTFTLTGVDAADSSKPAPMPEGAKNGKVEVSNDEAGNVDFGKVVYHFADLDGQTERKFTYTVTESGKVAGVTNDANLTRTFTVTLHDNGDGTLSATTDPVSGALFAFTNAYSAGKATDAFKFTKKLSGRALNKGEFTFTLTGGADAPLPEGAKNGAKTVTNGKDGKIAFGTITYSKPGTYAYTVREVAGNLGGVTYDDTVYAATVTVVDNHDGTMSATHHIARMAPTDGSEQPVLAAVSDKDAVFANAYVPVPTEFTFNATKALKGRALKDGEFTFELRDADGKTLQQAKNTAHGTIAFKPITFEKAGEYKYTIREAAGDAQGISYDKTVYTAKVTVADNLNGTMTATATYSSGLLGLDHKTPAFENTYTPPLSDTGSNTAAVAALALAMLGGGLMIIAIRRKREGDMAAFRGKHCK